MKALSTVFIGGVLSVSVGVLGAATPGVPPATRGPVASDSLRATGYLAYLDSFERAMRDAGSKSDRERVLRRVGGIAASMRSEGEAGYGEIYRYWASETNDLGDVDGALRILQILIDDPPDAFNLSEAYRMMGQFYLAKGYMANMGAAEDMFRKSIEVAIADPETVIDPSRGAVYSAITQYARIEMFRERFENVLWANAVVVGEHRSAFEDDWVRETLGTNADVSSRLGRDDEALAWLDRLFTEFPRYGLDSDRGVGTRLRWLRLMDPTRSSPDYLGAVTEMWASRGIRQPERVVAVGQALVGAHQRRSELDRAIDVQAEVVERLDQMLGDVGGDVSLHGTILGLKADALRTLIDLSSEPRPIASLHALDELERMRLPVSPGEQQYRARLRQRLEHRIDRK